MTLQEALDIAHAIRERWPHVWPVVAISAVHPRIGGVPSYVIGTFRLLAAGGPECNDQCGVFSSRLEWSEFLQHWRIFAA